MEMIAPQDRAMNMPPDKWTASFLDRLRQEGDPQADEALKLILKDDETDGITEAMNPANEQFGREQLDALLLNERHLSLDGLTGKIVEAVKLHAGTAPQSDDITLVAIRRTEVLDNSL